MAVTPNTKTVKADRLAGWRGFNKLTCPFLGFVAGWWVRDLGWLAIEDCVTDKQAIIETRIMPGLEENLNVWDKLNGPRLATNGAPWGELT